MQTCRVTPAKANLFPISLLNLTRRHMMDKTEKLLRLHEICHGTPSPEYTLNVIKNEYGADLGLELLDENGNLLWTKSKTDITFDYVTRFM